MKVCVVIPTHNRVAELRELVRDLQSQRLDAETSLRVLVVDSPAGNGSQAVAEELNNRPWPVGWIETTNVLAAKRNAGAQEAIKDDALIFLDDDMRIEDAKFVEKFVASLSRHAGAIVSGGVSFPTEWIDEQALYRFKSRRHSRDGEEADLDRPNRFVAMNHAMDVDTFRRSGGFDEKFRGYGGEDIEFALRCKRIGIPLVQNAVACAVHRETRLDVGMFVRKNYDSGFHGIAQLTEFPEAHNIPTIRLVVGRRGDGQLWQIGHKLVNFCSRPAILTRMTKYASFWDRRVGAHWHFYALTLAALRAGYADRAAGKRSRYPSTWGSSK